jgi:hypothetical protein
MDVDFLEGQVFPFLVVYDWSVGTVAHLRNRGKDH